MAFVQLPLREGGGFYVRPTRVTAICSLPMGEDLWSVGIILSDGSQNILASHMEEAEANGYARHLVQLLDGSKFN